MGVHTGDSTHRGAGHDADRPASTSTCATSASRCCARWAWTPGAATSSSRYTRRDRPLVVIEMNPRWSRSSAAGLQGDRVPDRQDRHQARRRLHLWTRSATTSPARPRPASSGAGLRRRQDPRFAFEKSPRRGPDADHDDEERREAMSWTQLHEGARQGERSMETKEAGFWTRPDPEGATLESRWRTSPSRPTGGSTAVERALRLGATVAHGRAAAAASTRGSSTRSPSLVELRTEILDTPGTEPRAAAPGQARRPLRPAGGRAAPRAGRRARGADPAPPPRRAPGVQDGGHLCRRVRRAHPVPLQRL